MIAVCRRLAIHAEQVQYSSSRFRNFLAPLYNYIIYLTSRQNLWYQNPKTAASSATTSIIMRRRRYLGKSDVQPRRQAHASKLRDPKYSSVLVTNEPPKQKAFTDDGNHSTNLSLVYLDSEPGFTVEERTTINLRKRAPIRKISSEAHAVIKSPSQDLVDPFETLPITTKCSWRNALLHYCQSASDR